MEFRQSQQLVMTPQLQQAIKLLQLSNLELAEYVEQQLEENPFLQRDYEAEAPAEPESDAYTAQSSEAALDLSGAGAPERAQDAMDTPHEDASPGEAGAGDSEYRTNDWATTGSGGRGFEDDREFGETLTREISLRDHLIAQLHIASLSPIEAFIGSYIIDLIDDAGYLPEASATIAQRLGADVDTVEQVVRIIQAFEPCGVGARDLKECLRLQLIDRDRFDPAMAIFIEHLELFGKGDLKGLMRVVGVDEEDIRDMLAEVRSLNPKPGYAFGSDTVQVVIPDVFVRTGPDGGWKVELNSETLPRILVNQRYFAEVSKTRCKDDDAAFLTQQLSNANWLAKSLDQRARTILKVASEIVRQQDGFFVHGVQHLRPLNLRIVADAISMHESTVSRVTANKYMATPRGIYELKYFFTASISATEGGEAHSAEAVRHRIKTLIGAETAKDVLSDDRIVEILRAEGVDIARRTVAKYRETMHIPSSVQRRRMALREAI